MPLPFESALCRYSFMISDMDNVDKIDVENYSDSLVHGCLQMLISVISTVTLVLGVGMSDGEGRKRDTSK